MNNYHSSNRIDSPYWTDSPLLSELLIDRCTIPEKIEVNLYSYEPNDVQVQMSKQNIKITTTDTNVVLYTKDISKWDINIDKSYYTMKGGKLEVHLEKGNKSKFKELKLKQ